MVTMFDSIDLGQIPSGAGAVAGYVNGHWPTYPELATIFPKANRLSIAVTAAPDADCLDVEKGDASVFDAAAWVKRQQARGVQRPVIYTSLSQAITLLNALAAARISRSTIRLWTAHYSYKPHICDYACGFGFIGTADGTQWTDKAFGRNLDQSLLADSFFPALPKPRPLWPVPVPSWFWSWAQWVLDGKVYQRPWDAPPVGKVPPWAWVRLRALEK